MKFEMNRSSLSNREDIINAVIDILSDFEYPTEDTDLNETWTVFQYYSGMESGGHESLFNQNAGYIEHIGIQNYVDELVTGLEKIGANEYANIEADYAMRLYSTFVELGEDEYLEEAFYEAVENADNTYYELERDLEERLERYLFHIHTDLIEINEEK